MTLLKLKWKQCPPSSPVLRSVKHLLLAGASLAVHGNMAQLSDRAPTYTEALLGIDTASAYDLDIVCEEPRHWALKRAFRDLSGTAIDRDSSGQLIEVQRFIGGIAHGTWYSFDSTGHVIGICVYDTASTTGPCVQYFPSGAKHREGLMYRPGVAFSRIFIARAEGIHRTYYEGGDLEELEYVDGNTHTVRRWYLNGQIASVWVDSAGVKFQTKWCPNGRLVGSMTFRRVEGPDQEMRGTLVLAHARSGETFRLKARSGRYVLKSDWDGERIVLHSRRELNQLLNERNLEDVEWNAPCEPRLLPDRTVEDP